MCILNQYKCAYIIYKIIIYRENVNMFLKNNDSNDTIQISQCAAAIFGLPETAFMQFLSCADAVFCVKPDTRYGAVTALA